MRTWRWKLLPLMSITVMSAFGACGLWPPGTPISPTATPIAPIATHTGSPALPTRAASPETPTHTPTPVIAGPFSSVPLPAGFPYETLTILQASPDGRLWLRSGQTILVLADEVWSIYLADFSGKLLGLDSTGRAWVVNESGSEIAAWDGNEWRTFGEAEGWVLLEDYGDGRTPVGIVSDHMDQVWLGTGQDVRMFDGSQWRIFTAEDMGLPPRSEGDLLATFTVAFLENAGGVWVGSCYWTGPGPDGGPGVLRFDGASWRRAGAEVSSGCTTAIQGDDQGRVWIGLNGDLWRFDPASGEWTQFTSPDSPMGGSSFFNWVPVIVLDAADEPWVEALVCGGGGCGGEILYRVREGTWIQIMEMNSHYFRKLVFDAAGTPWLFVEAYSWDDVPGQIYRVVDDQLELVAQMRLRAVDVTVDLLGRVWFVVEGEQGLQLWVLEPDDT